MTRITILAAAIVVCAAAVSLPIPESQELPMKKATPIITVDEIEGCLPFWTEGLGFEITGTVPHGDKMGFAMLQGGNVELMYQSKASVDEDLGPAGVAAGFENLAEDMVGAVTTLFIEVESIDAILPGLEGATVVVPRRQTFYGMDEVFVMAPCGTLVGFAAPVEEGEG